MVERHTWIPPETPMRRERARVPGALGGSRLLELPALAELRAALDAFLGQPGPIAVEVGFDFGETLLGNARDFPEIRWLGVEIRAARAARAASLAPANCLAARLDARTLFASGLVDGRLARVDILFPTPAIRGRHLLLTPAFIADVAHALEPGAPLTIATDVPALAELVADLLAGWREVPAPARTEALSRRERACRREALPVWTLTRTPITTDFSGRDGA